VNLSQTAYMFGAVGKYQCIFCY